MSLVQVEGWNSQYLGKNIYELVLKAESVLMTGAQVNTDLYILFPFRLIRVELKHTDNATPPGDSTDALEYWVYRSKHGLYYLFSHASAVIDESVFLSFGEQYEFPATVLRIGLDTTSTDRIFPVVTIQRL